MRNTQISNVIKKNSSSGNRVFFFHADRQMDRLSDMTKVIIAFCNFANAPIKNDHSNAIATVLTKHQFHAAQPLNTSTNNEMIFVKRWYTFR